MLSRYQQNGLKHGKGVRKKRKTNVDFFQVGEKEAVPYKNIWDTVSKRGIVVLRWD